MFGAHQAAQRRQALPIQVFRHQVSEARSGALCCCFFLQPEVLFSMSLMAHLPLRRFACEPRVPAHLSCWPVQWPRSHTVPCCRILVEHCSAIPPSMLTTASPTCVAQFASCLQMLIVVSWGIQRRRRQSVLGRQGALLVLSRDLLYSSSRVEQVSSDTFQPCEVCPCCSTDCGCAFLAGERDVRSVRREVCQSC